MRRRGHCALPSRRRRSPSCTPDRGHEVAGSRGRRKVSVAPGRRSGPSRRRGRAGAHSGGLRASACAAVLWRQGSPRPPGPPSPANRRPRHPQLRPPGPDRTERRRGGAGRGRTCLANRPHYKPPRHGHTARLNRAIPSALGTVRPFPAWTRYLGWAPQPQPRPGRVERAAVSSSLRRPSVLPDCAPSPTPRMSKTKSWL